MAHTVTLDANVLDWLLQASNLNAMLELRRNGGLEPIVTAEVAHEVYRMPDEKAEKRELLAALIRDHFVPVKPTFVPIAGLARAGLAYIATPRALKFLNEVRERGLRKLDALHVTNAHFHECEAFLTLDDRLLGKQDLIRPITSLKLERPEVRIH